MIFAFVARQGAVTMDAVGKPSSEFAIPVARAMRNWTTADTKVFAVPDLKSVIYTNGGQAFAFNVTNLKWSSPCSVVTFAPGEIISGVIQNRRLKITILANGVFKLYEFDEPPTGSSTTYIAKTPDIELNPAGRANILGIKAKFHTSEAGATGISVFTDYSQTADKTISHAATGSGMQTSGKSRWYLPRREALAVSFVGIQSDFTKDCYPSRVAVFGTAEESNNFAALTVVVPPAPNLNIYLLDDDGAYLLDDDGAYLLDESLIFLLDDDGAFLLDDDGAYLGEI